MKRLIEKYLGWLKDSNRPKHLVGGMLVFLAMITVSLTLGISLSPAALVSFVATCLVAVSVDYKDRLYGGKFDWLDVAATVLVPGVVTVFSIFIASIL